MAQLYFRYGTMNSGKSIEILKVAYNYEEQGKPVVLLTSRLDNRDGVGYISSRIGMKRKAYPIGDDTDIFGYIANMGICYLSIYKSSLLKYTLILLLSKYYY